VVYGESSVPNVDTLCTVLTLGVTLSSMMLLSMFGAVTLCFNKRATSGNTANRHINFLLGKTIFQTKQFKVRNDVHSKVYWTLSKNQLPGYPSLRSEPFR
jgi:hypothetical protein